MAGLSRHAPWMAALVLCAAGCGGGGGGGGTTTHSISGTVSGPVVSGITVTLAGPSPAVATTDGSGRFTFAGLKGGIYAVTPSLATYVFSPACRPVWVAGADLEGQAFAISFDGPSLVWESGGWDQASWQ